MVLFLSGGGSGEKSKEIDRAFVQVVGKDKPILYIPLARDPPYDACLDWILDNFAPFNFNNIKMILSVDNLKRIDLRNYSGIYIGGGDTYRLLKDLIDAKFLKILADFVNSGGHVYGGSAGAIIFGKSIETSSEKNKVFLRSTNGLNMIGQNSIFCHYTDEDNERIETYIKKNKTPAIAIPENAGIIVEDNTIKTIGPRNVFLFDGSEKNGITPGNPYKLQHP